MRLSGAATLTLRKDSTARLNMDFRLVFSLIPSASIT